MLKQKKKAPKLRASAAQVRALVNFGVDAANRFLDPMNEAHVAAASMIGHLSQCYGALSRDEGKWKELLEEHSIAFGHQFVALEDFLRMLMQSYGKPSPSCTNFWNSPLMVLVPPFFGDTGTRTLEAPSRNLAGGVAGFSPAAPLLKASSTFSGCSQLSESIVGETASCQCDHDG